MGSGEYEYSDEEDSSFTKREYNITKEVEDNEKHTKVEDSEEVIEEYDHNYVSSGELEEDKANREEHLAQDEYTGPIEEEEK